MTPLNAITCDVEDYFQVESLRSVVPRERWETTPWRLERNAGRVLDLFDRAGVRGTFFVLGWWAERLAGLVKRIAGAGHEIASHGYAHRMITEQSPEEFRADVRRAKALLEDLVGQAVAGYRAPTFSITERTLWAVDILAEEGYGYDSSIFPIRHDRYGIPSAPRHIHLRHGRNGATLVEFPPTTLRMLGCNLPVAGGGYLRLLPARLVHRALRAVNRRGWPAIVYFHPWELDPEQPRLAVKGFSRFRHYVNLHRTAAKLRFLLSRLQFTTAGDVVEAWRASQNKASQEPSNG